MFASGRAFFAACAAWAISLVTIGQAVAQPTPAIRTIQELMRAAYPELDRDKLTVSISSTGRYDMDWLDSGTYEIVIKKADDKSSTGDELFLAGRFFYEEELYIAHAVLSGRYLHTKSLHELESAIEHATDPDRALASGLARLQARYRPDKREEFVRDHDLGRFENVLGAIQQSELVFQWRIPEEDGGGFITPGWYLRLQTIGATGTRVCYSIFFEPVNGRLVSLVGSRCE
jgi:hypothetical protein